MTALRRANRSVLLAALALPLAACGYKLAGSNTFLPQHVRTIALMPFENRTTRTEIEQRVTEQVANELAKRGRYRVVTDPEGAHALLEGAVTNYRENPVQFTGEGRATRVEAVITVQAVLRDLTTDTVLWSQTDLLFREQYDVPGTGEFVVETSPALDAMARGAAGVVVTSILEGF